MTRLNNETVLDTIELQHLILDWGHELDINGGINVASLCTDDCNYLLGGISHRGRDAITKFYAGRAERIRLQQKDGVRTQRHTLSNIRAIIQDKDHATVRFMVVNYSAEGKAPARDLVGPTIVADARMECRRDSDLIWRIALFDSQPIFVGNDPFLNASVVKK